MSIFLPKKRLVGTIGVIFLVALLLVMPQIVSKSMMMGSDNLFHFNRFYDVACQIETGNFQPFIHMYGFQQSGRIVNALYGPLMAYFQGFLVFLSPSWFGYQVLSNILLYMIAGCSMYSYLTLSDVKYRVAVMISLLFMTTFTVQYWVVNQSFSGWGGAFLPLCLLPTIQFQKEKRYSPLAVGFSMALMTQIHLLSAGMLAIIYFVYFCYLFFQKDGSKKQLIGSVAISIGLFFCLTANLWYSFWTIYQGNTLVQPFVNKRMHLHTVTANRSNWLFTPLCLFFLLLFSAYQGIKNWKRVSRFERYTFFLAGLFFLLSTNLIPWKFLMQNDFPGVRLIQFPFRFFIPCTVFLLILSAKWLSNHTLSIKRSGVYSLVLFFSLLQTIGLSIYYCSSWYEDPPIPSSKHLFVQTADDEALRESFFSKDKELSLALVEKSTPDYLPKYGNSTANNYVQYEKYILEKNLSVTKYVKENALVVVWQGEQQKEREIPVVIYKNTQVSHNGEALDIDKLSLSSIGTPKLADKEGENVLTLTYKEPAYFSLVFFGVMFLFLLVGGYLFYQRYRSEKHFFENR